MSRASPNLHYEEDWTHRLDDSPLKRLYAQNPQTQTGEWLLGSEELQEVENQFYRNTREPEIQQFRDIRGEPEKRADHGQWADTERSQVQARRQEAKQREARSKSVNHQRNLQATLDHNSPSPPPPTIHREEKIKPKDKSLHSTAHSRVVTNPRTRSKSRKVK